ncbi:hypothetical protein DSM03_101942 [Leeuwenhoekiella aestuarii]|uniref:DUF4249 family protein n=1 Tax=Leeuwenhoekiella aestuarii TaxID=2249426 RepID=A0A4Q0NZ79_9FLAO|nr:DUF6252 family protein [Leeuwenhoekiella aestuarii]RXG18260.1 hypothetical protein DSM04_101453 [Leeuwenhoekiella aestuarii]RXG19565.1 hypothetical protein DSM03_101942 [Leeuwenhoekiella aestuarii]
MRKYILVLICLLTVLSCSDDITFNSPALQGIRDTVLFRSNVQRVELLQGSPLTNSVSTVKLSGTLGEESVQFNLPVYGEGVFDLEPNAPASAIYINSAGKIFNTDFDGEGQIIVSRVEDSTYTGTFSFRAVSVIDTTEVYFTKGVFYEVPFFTAEVPIVEDDVVATSFFCRINGNPFSPPSVSASAGSQFITGTGANNTANIRLRFPKDIEPGTYELTGFGNSDYQVDYFSGFPTTIVTGTLTITSHNFTSGSVGGTFSFTAQGNSTIQVTSGTFGFNYL